MQRDKEEWRRCTKKLWEETRRKWVRIGCSLPWDTAAFKGDRCIIYFNPVGLRENGEMGRVNAHHRMKSRHTDNVVLFQRESFLG